MSNNIKITLLGGDRRQVAAAARLKKEGYRVCMCAIPPATADAAEFEFTDNVQSALGDALVLLLPLPSSTDGIRLNSPLDPSFSDFRLTNILTLADTSLIIIGGKLPPAFVSLAKEKGFRVFDYFSSEVFQIKNAYTTAEAALSIAMNSLTKNIRGAKIAVTGYGRIAKHLVGLLLCMGADVTVAARRESDIAWAQSAGCRTLRLSSDGENSRIYELQNGYDIIYNTVPFWLFDKKFLVGADRKTLIIDLASAPGGVDVCAAKELGSNISWALSLPGKYAPESAGELIAECVDDIIAQEVRDS